MSGGIVSGRLLFVNKNATNLQRRTREEKYIIKSHVRAKRTEAQTTTKSAAQIKSVTIHRQGHLTPISLNGENQVQSDIAGATSEDSSQDRDFWSGERQPQGNVDLDPRVASSPLTAASARELPLISPTTMMGKGNTDPFATTTLPLNAERIDLIKVWESIYLRSAWPVAASDKSRSIPIGEFMELTRDSFSDDMRLNSVFAMASVCKSLALPPSKSRKKVFAQGLDYQSKALTSIRGRLASPGNVEHVILAIWLVSGVSFYTQDIPACTAHAQYMNNLVENAGGLQMLSTSACKLLLHGALARSYLDLEPFPYTSLDVDPGDFESQTWSPDYDIRGATQKYFHKMWYERSPKPIQPFPSEVVQNTIEFLAAKALADDHAKAKPGGGDVIYKWLYLRGMALVEPCLLQIRRLDKLSSEPSVCYMNQSLTDADIRAEQLVIYALKASLYATLYLCLRLFYQPNIGSITIELPFRHLRPLVNRVFEHMFARGHLSHLSHLLWVLFIGCCIEETQLDLPVEGRWHSIRFIEVARRLGLSDTEDAKWVLRKYIYREDESEKYLTGVWDKMRELRQLRPSWPI